MRSSKGRIAVYLTLLLTLFLTACATTPATPAAPTAVSEATTAVEPTEVAEATTETAEPTAEAEATTDTAEPTAEAEATTETAEPSGEGFPLTIEHQYGETTIPAAPQRIVSIGYTEHDSFFALGVEPVAVRYWYGSAPNSIFPWAEDEAAGMEFEELNMPFGELNLEAIIALNPDLITAVQAGISQEEYDALSQIAPTIAQSADYINFGTPWQEIVRTIGVVTGKSAEAETQISAVEAQFEATRAEYPEFEGKTVAVVYPSGTGGLGFYTDQDARARFFTDLGFVVPQEMIDLAGENFYADVSNERLDILDRDLIVFVGLEFVEGGQATVEANPLFSQLSAVQEGRVVYVPVEYDYALAFNTILSIPFLLEEFVPTVATQLEGATP